VVNCFSAQGTPNREEHQLVAVILASRATAPKVGALNASMLRKSERRLSVAARRPYAGQREMVPPRGVRHGLPLSTSLMCRRGSQANRSTVLQAQAAFFSGRSLTVLKPSLAELR
jgi:hypothetical protein